MKILKSWLYKLKEIKDDLIIVDDNLNIIFFDEWIIDKKIIVWANSRVEVYWLLCNTEKYNFLIELKKENTKLKMWYMILWWYKQELDIKIQSVISSNNSISDMKITSIINEESIINLDWILEIKKWLKDVKWNLKEENIFLWETWIINCKSCLFASSNKIEASHSSKIEKLRDDKLFYLRSRWIKEKNAISMIIDSYLKDMFRCIRMINRELYSDIFTKTNIIVWK